MWNDSENDFPEFAVSIHVEIHVTEPNISERLEFSFHAWIKTI